MQVDPHIEIAKIVAPFCGTIIGVWLAVVLGLGRYKHEKLWDRKLAAFSDVLTALSAMRKYLLLWVLKTEKDEPQLDRDMLEQDAAYEKSRRILDETIAVASIILPDETRDSLTKFCDDVDARMAQSELTIGVMNEEIEALDKILPEIIEQARQHLKISNYGGRRIILKTPAKSTGESDAALDKERK